MALLSARTIGLGLAATGIAHFVAPDVFVGITKAAFPKDTVGWVKRNGATEAAVGLALVVPKTRRLGTLGLLGYLGWLGFNGASSAKAAKANPLS
ncbi:hypothetical protein [Jatrophihabitans sp.]|uniref:hypothetical protein n=1 Tax=Jatrophihabitans sp. TaxID=1932789 RepID=UPI0030C71DDA|nr:hypothetical protein [Jatrophihabitans sp.]